MKLTRKMKYQVRFLYGIKEFDRWSKRCRWYRVKTAKEYCKDNPEWDEYWEMITTWF